MKRIAIISICIGITLLVARGEVRAAQVRTGDDGLIGFVDGNGRLVFSNSGRHEPAPMSPVGTTTIATPVATPPNQNPVDALIDGISARYGVGSRLVRAVIQVESAFDTRAVSNKGALGLMQLIPATARRFGVTNVFDPAENIEGGVRYLKFLLEKFQYNLDLSLAAYNSGENRVERLGRIPDIKETQDYVVKVRSAYTKLLASSSPATTRAPASVAAAVPEKPAAPPQSTPKRAEPTMYRTVDERGVTRFSNIGPGQ